VIINPSNGLYKLELFGISDGNYTITIQGNYGVETTDKFEYVGQVKRGEIYTSDVKVTAVIGPIDVYTGPPEFKEIIDTMPPSTTLMIGEPKYVNLNTYVSSLTPFTLVAEDNPSGVGVSSTVYRIYNSTFDTGWLNYTSQFYLTGLDDGTYNIDFYSIDNSGNVEPTNRVTVMLDNTPPITDITIAQPKYVTDMIYVTPDTLFTIITHDGNGSGTHIIAYRIFNSTYNSGWLNYTSPFTLAFLTDGTYTIAYNSTDNVRNMEMTHYINIILFSWDCIFKDCFGRQTILKINVKHKFFQLITPDKDYGIRQATYMRICGITIIIRHCDEEIRLISAAIPKFDFCIAIARDKQTRTKYFLLDRTGFENESSTISLFFY